MFGLLACWGCLANVTLRGTVSARPAPALRYEASWLTSC